MAETFLFLFKDIFIWLQFSTSPVQKPKWITTKVYLTASFHLTHSHTMTPFDANGKPAFWKYWEKVSNFSFSYSVFYSFGKLFAIFVKFEIVVCKLFQFGRV